MADLSTFDPNAAGDQNNNIFGLPFTEEEARLIVLPVPWEVSVSYKAGTSRAPDAIFKASFQVDLIDNDLQDGWKRGIYMKDSDKAVLNKSDYLRKEAELYIKYITEGADIEKNKYMCKVLKDLNEGSQWLNDWVYEQTKALLEKGKLVGLLGGDHSTPLGFYKALGEKYNFGILQIDAHCDLREAYEDLTYSHASIMYNALNEIPAISKLVQVGTRDYSMSEWQYIQNNNGKVNTFFDKDLKEKLFEGATWQQITHEIVQCLPEYVYISFDIDGLDPKLCPNTGTPVQGGLEAEETYYIFRTILRSGRKIIGFDLNEVGTSSNEWDENVGARILFKLCNLLIASDEQSH